MYTTQQLTPLRTALANANDLVGALSEATNQVELAIENEAATRRTAKELAQTYDDAECEFLADTPIDGKNADARKLAQDALLAKARRAGPLAGAWARKNAAQYAYDDARMALDQAERRFSATKAACALTEAILKASV